MTVILALLLGLGACRAVPAVRPFDSREFSYEGAAGWTGSLERGLLPDLPRGLGTATSASREASDEEYAPNLYRRFQLSAGGIALANFDTTAQVSSESLGAGAILDMEDLLSLDKSETVVRVAGRYAFNRRSSLELAWFKIQRDGSTTTDQDYEFGEVVIPAGDVRSQFDTEVVKLAYLYNFVADYRTTVAASAGIHYLGLDVQLEETGIGINDRFSTPAPLPVVGLNAAYALGPKWKLSAAVEVFFIEIGNFDGFMSDTTLLLENNLFEHVGWGFGYNGFVLDVTIQDDPLEAEIEYGYQGLMAFVSFYL